jgi:DNA invertase Pin-like site-specific DNA recombinase
MGLRIAVDAEETGSGANNTRPGLLRILDAARRGKIDVVLVWKLDRFGRSAFDLLGNLRQLEAAGVRFIATTQGIDIRPGGDPMSRLLLTMLSAVAEFERDLIVERTKLGLAHARRAGKRIGRPPVLTPPLEEVQRLRAKGKTWAEVASALDCTVWAARKALAKKGGGEVALRARRGRSSEARL